LMAPVSRALMRRGMGILHI